jgi:hypothetical protein
MNTYNTHCSGIQNRKKLYQHILIGFKHPSIHVPSIGCLWMVKISMYLKARKLFYYPMNTEMECNQFMQKPLIVHNKLCLRVPSLKIEQMGSVLVSFIPRLDLRIPHVGFSCN